MKNKETIQTPYGPKSSDFLCKAMDAYENQQKLLKAMETVLDLFEWDESGGEEEAAYDAAMDLVKKLQAV